MDGILIVICIAIIGEYLASEDFQSKFSRKPITNNEKSNDILP